MQFTLAYLFNIFSSVLMGYYSPDKSEYGVANFLGLKWAGAATYYVRAMHAYKPMAVLGIISELRTCDARFKGINGQGLEDGENLKETLFKILHS